MSTSRISLTGICLAAFFCLVMVLTVAGFLFKTWLPPVASEHGEGIDFLIHYLLVTTGIVFVVGHLALAWLVWRYTGQGPATYRPVKPRTEWLWALVPVAFMAVVSEVGVFVFGLPVWDQLYGELPDDAVEVEVVGKQFEWLVRYPGKDGKFGKTRPELVNETLNPLGLVEADPAATDDIVRRGVLRLPVGRTASVRLRTHDVLHSFSVAEFRVKQDLVPGFTTHTQFVPTRTCPEEEPFEIACAELCGLGHYRMRGTIVVMKQGDYDEWIAQQKPWFEY